MGTPFNYNIKFANFLKNIYEYNLILRVNNNIEYTLINKLFLSTNIKIGGNYLKGNSQKIKFYCSQGHKFYFISFQQFSSFISFYEDYLKIPNIDSRSFLFGALIGKNIISTIFLNRMIKITKSLKTKKNSKAIALPRKLLFIYIKKYLLIRYSINNIFNRILNTNMHFLVSPVITIFAGKLNSVIHKQ